MSDKAVALSKIVVGLSTPQGLSAMTHVANAFTKIHMVPSHKIIVEKTNQLNGQITYTEIPFGQGLFWEFEIVPNKAEAAIEKAIPIS